MTGWQESRARSSCVDDVGVRPCPRDVSRGWPWESRARVSGALLLRVDRRDERLERGGTVSTPYTCKAQFALHAIDGCVDDLGSLARGYPDVGFGTPPANWPQNATVAFLALPPCLRSSCSSSRSFSPSGAALRLPDLRQPRFGPKSMH